MAFEFNEGCFDGSGYNWSVSYNSGSTFQSVDFASFQNIVDNQTITGKGPDGNDVILGDQQTTTVSNFNGSNAIVSVGGSVEQTFTNSVNSPVAASPEGQPEEVRLQEGTRITPNSFPIIDDNTIGKNFLTIPGSPAADPAFDPITAAREASLRENTYATRAEVITDIRDAYQELIRDSLNAKPEIISGLVAAEIAFQSGVSREQPVGSGITPRGGEFDLQVIGTGDYYSQIVELAEAASISLPAAVEFFQTGAPNPLNFGFDINTGTFASNEDAELYAQARVSQLERLVNTGIDTVVRGFELQQAILTQNIDSFTSRNADGSVTVNPITRQDLLEVVSQDPQILAAVKQQLDQTGGNVSTADLRIDTLVPLSEQIATNEFNRVMNSQPQSADSPLGNNLNNQTITTITTQATGDSQTPAMDGSPILTVGEPSGPLTAEQRQILEQDQATADALALTNAVWAKLSGWTRGSAEEDSAQGGYPQPKVEDPYPNNSEGFTDNRLLAEQALEAKILEATDSGSTVNRILTATDLLETNGYGLGLTNEERTTLQLIADQGPLYAQYAAKQIESITQDIWALSTDTTSYNERQEAAKNLYNSLTPEQRQLIAGTEAGQSLNQWREDLNPFARDLQRNVPFNGEIAQNLVNEFDRQLQRWGDLETPGGRTLDQVSTLELAREYPQLVYYNDAGDPFFVTGKPLDELTRGDIRRFQNDLREGNITLNPTVITGGSESLSVLDPTSAGRIINRLPDPVTAGLVAADIGPIALNVDDITVTNIERELSVIESQLTTLPAVQISELTPLQELNQVLNTPDNIRAAVTTTLTDYFGVTNPDGQSAIERAVKLAFNQLPGVSEINRVVGTVRTITDATTTLTSDQLSAQDAIRATLSVIALANPAVGVLLRGLEFAGVFGGPTLDEKITTLNETASRILGQPVPGDSGGTGGGGSSGDAFADLFDADLAVDDDPYVSTGTPGDTSIRVLPEDLFVETEGGLNVLREEQEGNVENTLPEPVDPDNTGYYPNGLPYDDDGNLNPGWAINPETGEPYFKGYDYVDPTTAASAAASLAAARQAATLANARSQAAQQAQRKQANDGDWRVKLRLAPGAEYLYRDPGINSDGILWPLNVTDGVIFPYVPTINTSYHANYTSYDLTHSNYRGYFYQNSYVGEINMTAVFTAQDTKEAEYLLAVIHFFRSATKMFYGQDTPGRGSPPPLVYLQGLGEYQFNLHPCLISQFVYNLPNDVDYIRARSPNIAGTNLQIKRDRKVNPTNPFSAAIERLKSIGQPKGAINIPPAPPTLGTNSPTYVPTKIEIQLTLLPTQTRQQVSQEFSLQKFANGNLLKGGFW